LEELASTDPEDRCYGRASVKYNIDDDLNEQIIPTPFLSHVADVLGASLTGSQIIRITSAYAVDYDVDLPHPAYPFQAPNKRTALFENLRQFSARQQYQIVREMCDRVASEGTNPKVADLKLKLMSRYGSMAPEGLASDLNEALIVETRHWLDDLPAVKKIYDEALRKHEHHVFTRNALDDLRLALEKLLQSLFDNQRSLENQISTVGSFISARRGSRELANMFEKLIDYYTKYQNTYVKHDDAVPNAEVEFILEISSSFMKHLVRLWRQS
jgi:hypothetical protein